MAPILKKYWWLVSLAIAVLILKFSPDKLPFLEKIEKPKSETTSAKEATSLPRSLEEYQDHLDDKDLYLQTMTIRYRPDARREISIDGDAFDPRVSPDGTMIVFILKKKEIKRLAIADLQTNNVVPLDINLKDISDPSWDAEGKKIVFGGTNDDSSEIFTYDLDSKKLFQVTNDNTRKKYWPRFSPYKFDNEYRIAYSSAEKGRKDIWWVRTNGEKDMPLTFSPENLKKYQSEEAEKNIWGIRGAGIPRALPTEGGERPEWSPSGFELIYEGETGFSHSISYSYSWWWEPSFRVVHSTGILEWAPNQTSLIEYNAQKHTAALISLPTDAKKVILLNRKLTSMPAYFPDGRALACTESIDGKSILSIEPLDDPLGDVANLWMYKYNDIQKEKIAKNQLLFLHSNNDHIYNIYETEFYAPCGGPDATEQARPYLVTSDAVLETFYATFAALLGYTERAEFVQELTDFAQNGFNIAKEKRVDKSIQEFFLVGLSLIKPDEERQTTASVQEQIVKIKHASGHDISLFGQQINYDEFRIRGKYERDKDLQQYFQALKWFQIFKFDLRQEVDRKWVISLLDILSEPTVYKALEKINQRLQSNMGESRYYTPINLKQLTNNGSLPNVKTAEPWLSIQRYFKLFPSLYTLDAYIFDELITHTENSDTVGTIENPRLLPTGMDIMASFGSAEARKILLDEMKEGRFHNYEKKLDEVSKKILAFPPTIWDSDLYHAWLGMLNALAAASPVNAPEFTKSRAWKRKELNTALGSWVNLRYDTVAYVEGMAAECGEAGYELVMVGMPKGYVEPNPEFFRQLNAGFDKIRRRFNDVVAEKELRDAINDRISKFQVHLKALEQIAQKELTNEQITNKEYGEILYIGRIIEHFILIMNSISPLNDEGRGLSNSDSIKKIVYVQSTPSRERLYEGLGPANEINVIVPFFGRRQIVKGPVYSYYEFSSSEVWNNTRWRAEFDMKKGLPSWIKDYYEGTETKSLLRDE